MADDKTKDTKQAEAADEKKKAAPTESKEEPLSPDAKKKAKKEKDKEKAGQEKKIKKVDYGPDFKYIVRIANTDLDGTKKVELALTGIKGVGARMGTLIADTARVSRIERIGKLPDAQIETLAKTVDEIAQHVPVWAVNHPFDIESGADLHLTGTAVDSALRDDLNRLKKIASYRGVRHELGQKVRGQRTRSNGRTGLTVGVSRVKALEGAKKEEGAAEAAKPGAPAAAPAAGGAKPAAPAAGGKPGAAPAGGAKPAAPAGGAKPAAKPEGGKK